MGLSNPGGSSPIKRIIYPGNENNTSVSADNGHQQNLLNKLNLSAAKSRSSLAETEKDLETLRSSLAARKAAVAAATAAVQSPGLFTFKVSFLPTLFTLNHIGPEKFKKSRPKNSSKIQSNFTEFLWVRNFLRI